jgi:hypothetical protein
MLRLAEAILTATFRTLCECGRGKCECVVYWTGPASEALVDGFEHPVHRRSPFGYEVDDGWLTEFWKRLAASSRSVKVQIHSHPAEAFHSKTDDEWPIVSQPGFLSIVVPDFATGAASLDTAWIGRLQVDGTWRELASASEAVMV